ncbi:MAG: SusD/RagB family nutrient-binding outer membrane lipoprotein [Saprospiraceae bacterium]|nr:SusD/RagB family nutrient-binding outer membrane lipoprotein [Saprospiraceae bacterium]
MNTTYKNLWPMCLAFFLVLACTDDFQDLNIDPNNPSSPSTAAFLTSALTGIPGLVNSTQPMEYVQQVTQKQYTESSRYQTVNFSFDGTYSGPLANLQEIINLNTDPGTAPDQLQNGPNAQQIAVAKVLQSYFYWITTDAWGPIPYSQALQGRANFKPAYDTQEAVYNGLFSALTDAANTLDASLSVSGDVLYGGDLEKWKKWANSMRMIMAMRISDINPGKAQTEFTAAMNSGAFASNADNAVYKHLADQNNDNDWEDRFETRRDWAIAEPLANYLLAHNDPRVDMYADPALAIGTVVGMPYGLTNGGDVAQNDISFYGSQLRKQTTPTFISTYAEVLFAMAEAASKGWISGDAAQMYNDGIKASWEQWGVFDQTSYDAYITQGDVTWSSDDAIKLIAMQQWVHLYSNGFQAWASWRRMGYPILTPAPEPLNDSGKIPVRYGYPTTERDLNGTNWQSAVQALGGADNNEVRVWWDVN